MAYLNNNDPERSKTNGNHIWNGSFLLTLVISLILKYLATIIQIVQLHDECVMSRKCLYTYNRCLSCLVFQILYMEGKWRCIVRSHYCDMMYHIPLKQIQVGVTLNGLMAKTERIQYQAALALTGVWQGSCRSKALWGIGMGIVIWPSLL